MDGLESPLPPPTPYSRPSRSPTPSTFERGRSSRRASSACPSPPDPPPGSPLRIPRRTSSQSRTFTVSSDSQRKPLFLPAGSGNTVPGDRDDLDRDRDRDRDAATTPPPLSPALDRQNRRRPTTTDSFSTPPASTTPAKDLGPLRRSFSVSSSMSSSKVAKKRSSGFSLKKAWQMAGDEDNAANQLVADAASPSPAPRPSTGASHSRREHDWRSAARSLGSSKSSFDSDDFRSLGGSATTAASSSMKGSHSLDDKENVNNALSGLPLPSKRSSIFGSAKNRPKTSDANMELGGGGAAAGPGPGASSQQRTASPGAHAGSISGNAAGDQLSTPSPRLGNGSPKDRIKDWGKSTVHKIPLFRRLRSTTDDPDNRERVSRRKSTGFFGAAYDKDDVPLPSVDDGGADASLGASPLSRPASIAEESPNKSYNWQVDDDFTGNDLQVSDSPMLKFKQAADKYSEPDFAGAGAEEGASPNSARRFPLLGKNTKLDEIRRRELEAEQAIPQVDTAAPRPRNMKLDEIRQREIEGLPARTVAGLKLDEFREINSRARSPSPETAASMRDSSTPATSLHQQTPPSSTQSTPEKKHPEREADEGLTPAATIEPEPQPPLPSMDPIAELRSRSDPSPFAPSPPSPSTSPSPSPSAPAAQAPRPAPALLSRVSSHKMRESTILEEEGEQIPNTPVTVYQRGGEAASSPSDSAALDNGRHKQQDLLRRLARAASPASPASLASTSPADQKPIAPASGRHDAAAPAAASATTNHGRHDTLTDNALPSASRSKLPARTSSFYSSLTKHANANANANPNAYTHAHPYASQSSFPEKATTIRRTVSSPTDPTNRLSLSLPLPPETTTATVNAVANSGTSSRPPSAAFDTWGLRRVKSVDAARLRGKGKKMDDATDRIAAEMSLFAPGNEGSERGSIRAPSPVPSDWDQVDDDDLGAFNDNDATPKARRAVDPLSMPTPQVPGAFGQTPAASKPESAGAHHLDDDPLDDNNNADSDFRPRKLDFRPSPSPLRHEKRTGARSGSGSGSGSGLGAVGITAAAATATAATAAAAAAGFGLGAALGSSVGASSLAASTAAKAASSSSSSSRFGLSAAMGSRRRVSAESSSGVDSDPEDTTSVRQSRGTRDAKTRLARSLSRRRKPAPAKVPSAKDDLAELQLLHQIDSGTDKTLDDFENMMGASLSFSSDGSSPALDRSHDDDPDGGRSKEPPEAVVVVAADGKEQAQSDDDDDDTEAKEEKLANFVRRLSTSTLASIRDASKGIARLEDQVSHAEGRAKESLRPRDLEKPGPAPEAKPPSQPVAHQDLRPEIKVEPADVEIKEEIPSSIKLEDVPAAKLLVSNTPEPLPVPTTATAPTSGATVTAPHLHTRKPSFWFTLLGLVALMLAMWCAAETAVCNNYCRPAACDPSKPCVWNPSDPTWGTALPTKLDEWVADGAGASMLEQATDVVSDVWTDIFGAGDYDVVGRGFAQRRRMARRIKRRVNATRGGSPRDGGGLDGLGRAVTWDQKVKWDAWHRARVDREQGDRDEANVAEMREMEYAAELEEDDFGVDGRFF